MIGLFESISKANQDTGRIEGIQWGIVAATNDPMKLQRIQVYDTAKGGEYRSDWILRALPYTQLSPPIPKVGDLVAFGYIGGDPHYGVYVGLAVNQQNRPVGADSDLTIVLGSTKVSLSLTGTAEISGATLVKVTSQNIELNGNLTINGNVALNSPSCTISGKQVATVGATDTAGHTLVNKGW